MKSPPLGMILPIKIIEVYDGDTITVQRTYESRIRLLDCWAPEIRTLDHEEKLRGLAARDYLKTLIGDLPANGKLHIPTEHAENVGAITTLGRILGRVWVEGRTDDLSTLMCEAGHATRDRF